QVLGDGEPGEHLAVLGDIADAAAHDAERVVTVDAVTVEGHGAVTIDQSEDRLQRRRLADTVAAEHGRHAATRDAEADVLDDLLPTDARRQLLDPQDRIVIELVTHVAPPR